MTVRPAARSFKPRRRGLSPGRAARVAALQSAWGIDARGAALDLREVFGRDGPFVLDVGFGAGEALITVAAARPEECVIGVEVHTTGLAAVLEAIDGDGLLNVRVVDGDVLELLPRLAPASLDGVRILFPDPWPKRKQRHRRLVRLDVVVALVDRLRVGGTLHLATDSTEYLAQMEQVCAADGRLRGGVVDRPAWRPVTRFESHAVAAGRVATDFVYERI